MVRDLAERERRPESRGRNKCRRNKDRKRGGRKKEKSARKLGWGVVVCWGVGGLHSSTFPLVRGFWMGSGEGRKVEGGGEGWSAGEGPEWLLSASHVSKPVLKNE